MEWNFKWKTRNELRHRRHFRTETENLITVMPPVSYPDDDGGDALDTNCMNDDLQLQRPLRLHIKQRYRRSRRATVHRGHLCSAAETSPIVGSSDAP